MPPGADVERYVLPELRRHRVRFVQVGRHQLLTTAAGEGITTFSDTTEPDRLFVGGPTRCRRRCSPPAPCRSAAVPQMQRRARARSSTR